MLEAEPRRPSQPDQAVYAPVEDEAIDQLEEVDELPRRPRRVDYRHAEDDRPRRRIRRRSRDAGGEYTWLIAIGVSVASFFIGFGLSFVNFGLNGLAAEQNGNYPLKVGCLAFGVLFMLVFAGMGVIGVKTRTMITYNMWGGKSRRGRSPSSWASSSPFLAAASAAS